MSRLKNYCSLYTGNSISDSEKDNYQYTKDSIPYISTKDITLGTNSINYNNGMYISILMAVIFLFLYRKYWKHPFPQRRERCRFHCQ